MSGRNYQSECRVVVKSVVAAMTLELGFEEAYDSCLWILTEVMFQFLSNLIRRAKVEAGYRKTSTPEVSDLLSILQKWFDCKELIAFASRSSKVLLPSQQKSIPAKLTVPRLQINFPESTKPLEKAANSFLSDFLPRPAPYIYDGTLVQKSLKTTRAMAKEKKCQQQRIAELSQLEHLNETKNEFATMILAGGSEFKFVLSKPYNRQEADRIRSSAFDGVPEPRDDEKESGPERESQS